jgi:hypothetical protein
VNAESFAQGYPPGWAFYGKLFSNGVSVTVAESSEEPAPVKITLGPKAGRLLMKLFEGQSNKIIEKGQLKLCRIGEPKSCWQIGTFFPNGQYEILTPEVPFTIQFETWEGEWVPKKAFDDAGMPVEVIQVDLGARKELTVRLG